MGHFVNLLQTSQETEMVSSKAKHRHEEKVWEIISERSGILTGMMFRTGPLKFPRFTICHAYLFRSAHTKEVMLRSYSKEVIQ